MGPHLHADGWPCGRHDGHKCGSLYGGAHLWASHGHPWHWAPGHTHSFWSGVAGGHVQPHHRHLLGVADPGMRSLAHLRIDLP